MLSVVDLLSRIKSGALHPAGAIALSTRAIAEREPGLKAFVTLADDPKPSAGPLSGIAVAVKDIIDTADMPTTMGAPSIYAGWRPKADAPIVAALRRAGATIVGKSATTAFANRDPAPTCNPHDAAHTPGGSSAGSAAAVGAGLVPLALGTQTSGSIIRPASFCGAAAIKPSFRLLPTVGVKCLAWTLDTVGLFGAGVADLAVALEVLSGRPMTIGSEAPRRIGIVRQTFAGHADPDGETALDAAIAQLASAGMAVRDIDTPTSLAEAWSAHPTIMSFEAASALAWEFDAERANLPPGIAAELANGRAIAAPEYDEARRIANRGRREAKTLFDDVDAIITYSAPGAAPAGLDWTGDPRFNRVWTLLGTPCVNVPGLWTTAGLPIGVQIVTRFAQDALALDIAARLEGVLRRNHTS